MKVSRPYQQIQQVLDTISKQVLSFLRQRAPGRIETIRLAVYLVFSFMGILGMPLHFAFNVMGDSQLPLYLISIVVWLWTIVILLLFIYNKMSLGKAFFFHAVGAQLLECAGIIYLAASGQPASYPVHEDILFNETVCFTVFLLTCMGLMKNAPTCTYFILLITMAASYVINPAVMQSQMVIVFVFFMTCVWIYMILLRITMMSTRQELDDYKQFQNSVLDTLNMSKVEMVALVQICRQSDADHPVDYGGLDKFSRRTRDNLIRLGSYLKQEHSSKLKDLASAFPQLSVTELEVCRLVIKGMTLKEIAVATNKKLGNIGTVRGNIRRKLGLLPEEDLRETLLRRLKD